MVVQSSSDFRILGKLKKFMNRFTRESEVDKMNAKQIRLAMKRMVEDGCFVSHKGYIYHYNPGQKRYFENKVNTIHYNQISKAKLIDIMLD